MKRPSATSSPRLPTDRLRTSALSLLGLCLSEKKLLLCGSAALLVGVESNLLVPELARRALAPSGAFSIFSHAHRVVLAAVALFLIQSIAYYLRTYLLGILAHRVVRRLRANLYQALLRKKVAFFDAHKTSDLVSRVVADTLLIQETIAVRVSVILRYFLQVVQGLLLMCLLSPRLTILLIAVVPILIGVSVSLGKRLRKLSKQHQSVLGEAAGIAEQSFSSIRTVKACRAESFESATFGDAINRAYETIVSRTALSAFFQSSVTFLLNASLVIVALYGYQLAMAGAITWGNLVAFGMYGATVGLSAAFVAGGFSDVLQALGAVDRVLEFSSSLEEERSGTRTIPEGQQLTLEFQGVSFSYPQRPENSVLSDVSLSIHPGKFVALVGPSGSGKSTVTQLILGFYPPSNGLILLGGIPLDDLQTSVLRQHVAIVPQEPILFSGSIEANLRVSNPSATVEQLKEVCQAVNLHDFIASLPRGFETPVGERGLQLSGGQRQRLAIARALLASPSLLILDEATSSLDAHNEAMLQQTLSTLMGRCSLLVIAHRLATVQQADEILVVDGGQIRERGSHDELLARRGAYAELVRQQLIRNHEHWELTDN